MKLLFRIIALLLVVPATYFFVYWGPFALIPFGDHRWIANIVALLCALGVGWYVWSKSGSVPDSLMTCLIFGAITLGGIGFTAGFFGPLIFTPEANQGPLLGIFITGPLGFILGTASGFVYWLVRRKRRSR